MLYVFCGFIMLKDYIIFFNVFKQGLPVNLLAIFLFECGKVGQFCSGQTISDKIIIFLDSCKARLKGYLHSLALIRRHCPNRERERERESISDLTTGVTNTVMVWQGTTDGSRAWSCARRMRFTRMPWSTRPSRGRRTSPKNCSTGSSSGTTSSASPHAYTRSSISFNFQTSSSQVDTQRSMGDPTGVSLR